tara:strand:+ start:604 stop:852 length:249 start_codon:yes stop_codon:yes gene_type:complete
MNMNNEKLKDLILTVVYETAFKERILNEEILTSWKGYPFEVLNDLESENLIYQTRKSKSVRLSDEGIEKAQRILKVLENVEW